MLALGESLLGLRPRPGLASPGESDSGPLDPLCGCYVCRSFTKSYLRHLYRAGEISALIYNTYHNLHFMNTFMNDIRNSIAGGTFDEAYNKWEAIYGNGDI